MFNIVSLIYDICLPGELVLLSLIIYSIIIVTIDLRFNFSNRLITLFNIKLAREDLVFIHIIGIFLILIMTSIIYNINYFAIIDYYDVRLTILRARFQFIFLCSYICLGLSACIFLTLKASKERFKWAFYGLFFNILALLYFLSAKRKQS